MHDTQTVAVLVLCALEFENQLVLGLGNSDSSSTLAQEDMYVHKTLDITIGSIADLWAAFEPVRMHGLHSNRGSIPRPRTTTSHRSW